MLYDKRHTLTPESDTITVEAGLLTYLSFLRLPGENPVTFVQKLNENYSSGYCCRISRHSLTPLHSAKVQHIFLSEKKKEKIFSNNDFKKIKDYKSIDYSINI